MTEYEDQVKEIITSHPNDVLIDQATLVSFVKSNTTFEQARVIIAKNTNCEFYEKDDYQGELERFVLFKIESIGQFETIISQNQKHYLSFVKEFTKHFKEETLNIALPLFYFQHFLACLSESEEFVNDYFSYGTQKMAGRLDAKGILDIFKKSK